MQDVTTCVVVVGDLHLSPNPVRDSRGAADPRDLAIYDFVAALTAEHRWTPRRDAHDHRARPRVHPCWAGGGT